MFELERFIAESESAIVVGGYEAVREILVRAIADRPGIIAALGEPKLAEVKVLHRSPRLTILNALWTRFVRFTSRLSVKTPLWASDARAVVSSRFAVRA
jgi:hypothetical protein